MTARRFVLLLATILVWVGLAQGGLAPAGSPASIGHASAAPSCDGMAAMGEAGLHAPEDAGPGGADLSDEHAQPGAWRGWQARAFARPCGERAAACSPHLPGPSRPPCSVAAIA